MAGVNQETDQSQATFKQQLDRAATDTRSQDANNINPIVEKVVEYVPAAAKVLGVNKEPQQETPVEVPGPPNRPDHDPKIEEFVRDQHRSKTDDGTLITGS
jgi:hypothetical protein